MKIFVEHVSSISMKWYMTIGAILGGLKGFVESHGQDLVITFLLGFIGALGAGVAKIALEKIVVVVKKRKEERKKRKNI